MPAKGLFGTRPLLLFGAALLTVMVVAACGGGGSSSDGGSTGSTGGDGSGSSDSTGGGGTTNVNVTIPPGVPVSLMIPVGESQGIFEEHGITFTNVPVKNSPAVLAALQSGSVDVGLVLPETSFPAIEQGANIKALLNAYDVDYSLIAQNDTELPNFDKGFPADLKDLKGKTIGIVVRGGGSETFVNHALEKAGLEPSDVSFVAVGTGAEAAAAFEAHQVEVLFAAPPVQQILAEDSYKTLVNNEQAVEINKTPFYSYWAAGGEWLEDNEELAKNFCSALEETVAFSQDPANEAKVVEVAAESLNLPTDKAEAFWKEFGTRYKTTAITEEAWDTASANLGSGPEYKATIYEPCSQG